MVRDMDMLPVKAPAESKGGRDLIEPVAMIPGDRASRPIAVGNCAYLGKAV